MRTFRIQTKGLIAIGLFCLLAISPNQNAFAQYMCQINGTPEVRTGSIAAGDGTQTGRVFRDGLASTCTGGVPTQAAVAGTYRFDQYTFTNPGPAACVTVDLNATGCGGTANNTTQINAYTGSFNPANVMTNLIGKPGFSTIGTGSMAFPVAAGATFVVTVHEVVANGGCANYSITVTYRTNCRQSGFSKVGGTDPGAAFAFFRPTDGTWNVRQNSTDTVQNFGLSSDIPTHGDYTGDGASDLSTYRPSANTWFYSTSQVSPATNVTYVPFGASGDVPVPGDYDRDGKTDVALWRPSDGRWYIYRSSNATVFSIPWGSNGDKPITGDYDGDLVNDFGLVRDVGGQLRWYVLQSNFNYGFVLGCPTTAPFCGGVPAWGVTGDRPVSGDFDGDFKTDVAVFRPSNGRWYYYRSGTATVGNTPGASFEEFLWGVTGDVPQPADFDGDRKTDKAVFRPSNGTWWVSNSGNGSLTSTTFGTSTDQPVTSPYLINNP